MELVNKKVNVEEVTLTFNEKDFQAIGEWQSALASATKENAYDLTKDLAGKLERLLLFITKVLPTDVKSARIVNDEKVQDEPVRNGKRSSKKTTKRDKIKVTIQNINDNGVFQSVIRMLGRFVKCGDCMSIESQLRQDKGAIYLDNEQELDELLNVLVMYNLMDNKVPIIATVE